MTPLSSQWRAACLLGGMALVVVGCPRKQARDERLQLHRVSVTDYTPRELSVPGLDRESLVARVRQRLKKGGRLALVEKRNPDSYRLHVDLGLRRDRDGVLVAVVSARADRPGSLDTGRALQASGHARLEGARSIDATAGGGVEGPGTVSAGRAAGARQRQTHLLAVLDRAIDDVSFQAMLMVAREPQLVAALEDKQDPGRLAAAIEIAAVRRVDSAVVPLIGLLKHDDLEISDRAIGALVAIGDERAVKPLARLARFSDTARMAKVIDGIGALGGEEALAYLEFVAQGHPDADIRNLAREALERMSNGSGKRRNGEAKNSAE